MINPIEPSLRPQQKSILVTGGRGLIGSRFFQLFEERYRLISADLPEGYDILDLSALLEKTEADLKGAPLDAILHLAAFTDVSAAYSQTDDQSGLCYRLNVNGTENVIALAEKFQSHLIHVSTDFVFAGDQLEPLKESDKANPIEWYGETKLIAEKRVRDSNLPATIMRIAFPYMKAPGARLDLVATIRKKLAAGEKLFLFGDQIITPTFGDDIAAAMSAFVDHPLSTEKIQAPFDNTRIFHVTGPESLSPYELGCRLAEIDQADTTQITETSLDEYLKQDPRPRQKYLSLDTAKYCAFCADNAVSKPRHLEKALS